MERDSPVEAEDAIAAMLIKWHMSYTQYFLHAATVNGNWFLLGSFVHP